MRFLTNKRVVCVIRLVLCVFPFKIRLFGTYLIAFFIHLVFKSVRTKIRRNLSLISPDLSEEEINKGSLRNVMVIAKSQAVMFGNARVNKEKIAASIRIGGEGFQQFLEDHYIGRMIIAVFVHVGDLDRLGWTILHHKLRVCILVEQIETLRLNIPGVSLEKVGGRKTIERIKERLSGGEIIFWAVDITKKNGRRVSCQIGNARAIFPVGSIKTTLEMLNEGKDVAIYPILPSQEGLEVRPEFKLTRTKDINHDIEINLRELIEGIFARHIREHCAEWLRLPWADLEPADLNELQKCFLETNRP